MTPVQLIDRLAAQRQMWAAVLSGLDERSVQWRPDGGGWNLLELACHLADEERRDFKVRIEHTLRDPSARWPGIDPQGWVLSERYAERNFAQTVASFLEERGAALTWLATLGAADWSQCSTQGKLGTLSAGDLLASWVAHDLRHLAQASRLLYGALAADVAPYSVAYAG